MDRQSIYLLARAVRESFFRDAFEALRLAQAGDHAAADKRMARAERLEAKFTSQFGEHYSEFIKRYELLQRSAA